MSRSTVSRIVAKESRDRRIGAKLVGPRGSGVIEKLDPPTIKGADGKLITLTESELAGWYIAGRPRPANRLLQSVLDAARSRSSAALNVEAGQMQDSTVSGNGNKDGA